MSRSGRWLQPALSSWVGAVVYLCVSVVLLYPILASPVMADDLFNPYGQFATAGPGFNAAVEFGWKGSVEGGSFRILGTVSGSVYNWLWLASAGRLGIDPGVFFAVTKYVVLVASAASLAWCWQGLAEYTGRSIRFRSAFVWVSLVLFSTLQIHALWSNDPVANYPLAGYGAASVGFCLIGATARMARRPDTVRIALTSLGAVAAVLYYELNIGAVLGAFTLMVAAWWIARRSQRRLARRLLIAGVSVAGVPALVVAFGRTVTGQQSATYAGTSIRLSGAGATFIRGAITSLPGTAWQRSIDALGGELKVVLFSFGTVALCLAAVAWWLTFDDPGRARSSEDQRAHADVEVDTVSDGADGSGEPDADGGPLRDRSLDGLVWDPLPNRAVWILRAASVCAVVLYACFALALQSITVKVQDEAPGLGYVYTWYAITSSAVALGLAVMARSAWARRHGVGARVLLAVAVSVALVQSTVNWRLTERLVVNYGNNVRLVSAFDDDVRVEQRCAVLLHWRATQWPDYYEQGVTDGISEAFAAYFGESFCPLIESPPDP